MTGGCAGGSSLILVFFFGIWVGVGWLEFLSAVPNSTVTAFSFPSLDLAKTHCTESPSVASLKVEGFPSLKRRVCEVIKQAVDLPPLVSMVITRLVRSMAVNFPRIRFVGAFGFRFKAFDGVPGSGGITMVGGSPGSLNTVAVAAGALVLLILKLGLDVCAWAAANKLHAIKIM